MIIDIVIGVVLLAAFFTGWKKGIVYQLVSLIAVVAGFYAAGKFWYFIFEFIQPKWSGNLDILKYISIILTAILVIVAVIFIGKLLKKLIEISIFGVFDKILGGVLSLVEAAVVVSFIFYAIHYFFPSNQLLTSEKVKDSYTLPYITPIAEKIADWMNLDTSVIEDLEQKLDDLERPNIFA